MNSQPLTIDNQDDCAEERRPSRMTTALVMEKTDSDHFSEENIAERATLVTEVLEDILSKSCAFPHGGINE